MNKKELQSLISQGLIKKVLKALETIGEKVDYDLRNEIILQASRYSVFSKEKIGGLLSFEQENLQLAKINTALLDIINRLPEHNSIESYEQQIKNNCAASFYTGWIILELFFPESISANDAQIHKNILQEFLRDKGYKLPDNFISNELSVDEKVNQCHAIIKSLMEHFSNYLTEGETRYIEAGYNLLLIFGKSEPVDKRKIERLLNPINYPKSLITSDMNSMTWQDARKLYNYYFGIVKNTKWYKLS